MAKRETGPRVRDLQSSWLDGHEIVLFGAGSLGREMVLASNKSGLHVVGVADDTISKQGALLEGVPVEDPSVLLCNYPRAIWIVCVFLPNHSYLATKSRLKSMGIVSVYSFYEILRAYPENMPKYFFDEPEKYSRLIWKSLDDCLIDETSRHTLEAFQKLVLTGDFSSLPHHKFLTESPKCLPDKFSVIDAGAYDGDTLKHFLAQSTFNIDKYIALEPDEKNFKKLTDTVRDFATTRTEIIALNRALWSEDGQVLFNAQGNTASTIMTDNPRSTKVEALCLNTLFNRFELSHNTCIKLDIEGAELESIRGAEPTITKVKPILMISVYHTPHCLTSVYNLVRSYRADYKFALRYHAFDGADLMLYCY